MLTDGDIYGTGDSVYIAVGVVKPLRQCLSLFSKCRLSSRHSSTFKPSKLTDDKPLVAVASIHIHQHFHLLSLYSQKDHNYLFYCPIEDGRLGWPRHCSYNAQPIPKAVYHGSFFVEIYTCPRWDFNVGSFMLQSSMLLPHHCNWYSHLTINWYWLRVLTLW